MILTGKVKRYLNQNENFYTKAQTACGHTGNRHPYRLSLMAQEKGAEQPLNKFARFKKDIRLWYDEMEHYGLTQEEQKILEPIIKISYGICESQEG